MSGVPQKILVTGGKGFLGSAIVERLKKEENLEVFTLSRSTEYSNEHHLPFDLTDDLATLKILMKYINPDIVFHCASNPNTKMNEKNPNQIIIDNVCGTHNLLNALENFTKRPRIIFASSVTVYGRFDADHPANWTTRERPKSIYASTKLMCENLIQTFTDSGGIQGLSIRIPALVGVNSTHGLLHDLIRKVNSSDEVLELIGAMPGSKKPFCHVDEVADFFVKVGLTKPGYDYKLQQMILAGHYENLTVQDVAELVMCGLKKRKRVRWTGSSWAGDNPLINISPDHVFKSSSSEAIMKVVEESKSSTEKENG